MKLDLFLFSFALILAFVSGNITYFIKTDETIDLKDVKEIKTLHTELQEEVTPHIRLDLNKDYPSKQHLELLTKIPPINFATKNYLMNSSACLKSKLSQISSSFIKKETLWMAYLCNQVESLPTSFFNSAPFLHPSGKSYAYMKYKMLRSYTKKAYWLDHFTKYMHISELAKLRWPTSAHQRFLMNQKFEILSNIMVNQNAFASTNYYFIKTGNLKYYVLDFKKAKRFFKRARYVLSDELMACEFKIGNLCWKKKPHNIKSLFSQSTIVLFIGTLIILLITAKGLFHRLRRKKVEEERKKHALRTLTHELRTPITSLLLQINNINQTKNMSQELQEQIARIESQVYRLKHLAQKSQSYLQTDSSDLIHLNNSQISSLHHFCEEILTEYESGSIQLTTIKDSDLCIDSYWLRMCINNLLENAFRYGKLPIELELNKTDHFITIAIRDQGQIAYSNINQVLKAQHHQSKGLGLGLVIVNKTLKEMGAKLTLSNGPTEFKIFLPLTKEVNNA